jgi:superfamily II DNA or RNA helicase
MLRPYQQQAIDDLRDAIFRKERVVLAAPTGAGKTRIASEVFSLAREKGKRVAFVVPFLSLIDQTYKAFVKAGLPEEDISIVQAQHLLCNYAKPIQICSVDTLVRRPKLPEVDMVIFDEVHRRSKLHKRWMTECPDYSFIGLSATPWARGMKEEWDRLIIVSTTRELITQGYLSDYKYFAPYSPDLSNVKVVAGDYHEGQLADAMNKQEITADIVKTWVDKAERRPTLCFCVDRAHASCVQDQFLQVGISAGYVDAYTPAEERANMIEMLRKGHYSVICNIGTLTTGVDAPFVSCIILARPTKSEMLFLQIIGRGLRTNNGKENCLVLDHSNTGISLGLPCTINYNELKTGIVEKGKKAEKKEKPTLIPKKCPQCNYLKPIGVHECPECGFTPKKMSDIIAKDGQLIEFKGKNKYASAPNYDITQEWFSGLLYVAAEKGYKEGWAAHQFKNKFGYWPDKLSRKISIPSQEVRSYIRSRQIAYAKVKERVASGGIMGRFKYQDI